MGAAASVQAEVGSAAEQVASAQNQRAVQDGLDQVQNAVNQVDRNIPDSVDISRDDIASVTSVVPDGQRETVQRLFESVKDSMSGTQINGAIAAIKDALPNVNGDAILVTVSSSLQVASDMAPAVMGAVGGVLIVLGDHLPYIGGAVAALGAIAYAFKVSKENDENIAVVSLWMASVKDWLLLVASKIDKSGAASTVPLFKGLDDALSKMCQEITNYSKKWRITKMISSGTFGHDFGRAKEAVLDLKTALRDYLDQETQDRQEAALAEISNVQLETNEKLASMDSQLTEIRAMLQMQAEIAAKEMEEKQQTKVQEVGSEEERLFANIQRASGVAEDADVPFKRFVTVFESFFFNCSDMPPEQRRGLKVVLDHEGTGMINKPSWIKFYRQWIASELELEAFLNKVAEEHPTLFTQGKTMAIAIGKQVLKDQGIESVDDAKKMVEDAKDLAKNKAAELRSAGLNFLKGGNKTATTTTTTSSTTHEAPCEVVA